MIAAPPPLSSSSFATLAGVPDAAPMPDEILQPAEPPLVFCALGFERRAFMRFGKLPVVTTGPGAAAIRRAFAERDRWPVREPRMAVLLGLAGGLSGRIPSGSAAAVATVADRDGVALFRSAAPGATATVVESAQMVTSTEGKRALASSSGADLVDMESRAFAECATQARIPWAIVRGVSDDAATAVPSEFAGLVDSGGETRIARVLASIARRPALLGEFISIGRASRIAMRNASFTADALGCLEGLDLCSPTNPLLVFGGSFDPPHARHATVLAEAMRALHASAAIVIPAAINPLKTGAPPADPEARLAMCRENFASSAAGFPAEVRLSRVEIDRAGPSYTIDTIHALLARRPKLAGCIRFLGGNDAIRRIESWHRWRELLGLATPAVVVRPPSTRDSVGAFFERFAQSAGIPDAPSWILDIPPVDLASTDIRAAIARGERPAGLADGVWREITARGLYGFGSAR
ncbi:MAG: nicotinate-nucleotide adenylyltransferase [Planctomycetota bacterium]